MSFMNSYKRLDKLCLEIYPHAKNGVSAYIEDMEQHPTAAYRIPNWEEDYKQLKHYRWVRNQISHTPDCEEDTMCTEEDIIWLENFYQCIMNQADPISQLVQSQHAQKQSYIQPQLYSRNISPSQYANISSSFSPAHQVNPPSRISPSSKKKKGCYIATCVYGSYDCPAVWTLRQYRDKVLSQSFWGKVFIRIYYAVSPSLVKHFGNIKCFRSFWKYFLNKIVKRLMKKGFCQYPYYDSPL